MDPSSKAIRLAYSLDLANNKASVHAISTVAEAYVSLSNFNFGSLTLQADSDGNLINYGPDPTLSWTVSGTSQALVFVPSISPILFPHLVEGVSTGRILNYMLA